MSERLWLTDAVTRVPSDRLDQVEQTECDFTIGGDPVPQILSEKGVERR